MNNPFEASTGPSSKRVMVLPPARVAVEDKRKRSGRPVFSMTVRPSQPVKKASLLSFKRLAKSSAWITVKLAPSRCPDSNKTAW
jgi:hypothetical protein